MKDDIVVNKYTVVEVKGTDKKISYDRHTANFTIKAAVNLETNKVDITETVTASGKTRSSNPKTFVNIGSPPPPTKKVDIGIVSQCTCALLLAFSHFCDSPFTMRMPRP